MPRPGPRRPIVSVQLSQTQIEELVEQYLVFLRGYGPEPSLSIERRKEIRALLDLIDILVEREVTR
jgi:hypothetical protein